MDLKSLTLNQLHDLNKAICAEISLKRSADAAVKISMFAVGDRVHYKGSAKSAPFNAVITKVLRTNVDVTTDAGKPWRINASLLTKI